MGNNKKSSANFLKESKDSNNKVILAAIGGAVAGVAIASILSSEKGRAWVGKMGETAAEFAKEYKGQVNFESISNFILNKVKK